MSLVCAEYIGNGCLEFLTQKEEQCYGCGEKIEVGEYITIMDSAYYCECCIEDYKEEGRPL